MKGQDIKDEQLELAANMLEYAGKDKRSSDLWQDKDNWAKGKKLFSNMFADVENVLL